MPGLHALVLATPLFGLALTPPVVWGLDGGLGVTALLQVAEDAAPSESEGASAGESEGASASEGAPTATVTVSAPSTATATEPTPAETAPHVQTPEEIAQAEADRQYTQDVMRRREIGQVHRAMGIATWIAMTGNLVIGMFQYNDRYGWGAGVDQTPCSTGHNVILNECSGTPWAHVVSASVTTTLYSGTFLLSLVMPDPNQADRGNGSFAEHLRIHEVLRWIHSLGMLAQVVIGALLSNGVFGDRANHYDTMQAMATVHQTLGWVTWGALTGAAAVMLF
jgi:hypothetical protein